MGNQTKNKNTSRLWETKLKTFPFVENQSKNKKPSRLVETKAKRKHKLSNNEIKIKHNIKLK